MQLSGGNVCFAASIARVVKDFDVFRPTDCYKFASTIFFLKYQDVRRELVQCSLCTVEAKNTTHNQNWMGLYF